MIPLATLLMHPLALTSAGSSWPTTAPCLLLLGPARASGCPPVLPSRPPRHQSSGLTLRLLPGTAPQYPRGPATPSQLAGGKPPPQEEVSGEAALQNVPENVVAVGGQHASFLSPGPLVTVAELGAWSWFAKAQPWAEQEAVEDSALPRPPTASLPPAPTVFCSFLVIRW